MTSSGLSTAVGGTGRPAGAAHAGVAQAPAAQTCDTDFRSGPCSNHPTDPPTRRHGGRLCR